MIVQATPVGPITVFDLLRISSTETKVVLGLTAVLSLISWFLIGFKGWQLRRIRRRSERFFLEVERAAKLQDAYRMAMKLPQSPFNRLFREGMSFYTELHPGAFKEGPRERITMAPSQLEALKMILGKEVAAERDRAARFVPWLATIGSVSPLMGLLGTVLGVMDAFLGISSHGSGNIASVAPGVAEALITTVAGLAAAIPAVMAYNYFSSKINEFESELEGFGYSLIGWLAREGLL